MESKINALTWLSPKPLEPKKILISLRTSIRAHVPNPDSRLRLERLVVVGMMDHRRVMELVRAMITEVDTGDTVTIMADTRTRTAEITIEDQKGTMEGISTVTTVAKDPRGARADLTVLRVVRKQQGCRFT